MTAATAGAWLPERAYGNTETYGIAADLPIGRDLPLAAPTTAVLRNGRKAPPSDARLP